MKVLTVNSEKGGTSKTTTATHVAAGLALRGKRALLLDVDPQSHATISFNLEPEPGIYQVLVRGDDILDHLRQPAPETYQIAGQHCPGRLYVLPSNDESSAIPGLVKDVKLLAQHLTLLEDAIDVVVIDTPPTPGLLMSVIYNATDYVLIPTELARLSLEGLIATVASVHKFDVALLGIVPNKYERRKAVHNHNLKWLVKAGYEHEWPLFMPLGDRVIWEDASQEGRMVWTMEAKSKSDQAGQQEAFRLVEQVERALDAEKVSR